MNPTRHCHTLGWPIALCLVLMADAAVSAERPAPVLDTVFPAGAAAGQTVDLTITGSNLQAIRALECNAPGVRCQPLEPNRLRLAIPPETPPGMYDLWAVGENGVSSPRTFFISNRLEQIESEPNESVQSAQPVPLDVVVNGRIDKGGDLDYFRFDARRGQRVVIECWAERIDSRLRAVLEIFDAQGRRLAVNRGYFGIDPLIDFRVPADGSYVVKVQDLISTGSAEHFYRLDIDSGPRVAFTMPNVVQHGQAARVTLFGWNLNDQAQAQGANGRAESLQGRPGTSAGTQPSDPAEFDRVEVEISSSRTEPCWPLPVRLAPAQAVFEGFAYHYPASHAPVVIGVSDVPVVPDRSDNHSPASAQLIQHPCEVSGQLEGGDERDWFAIAARRGEVLYLEALGQRISSPVDLQLSVLDATGTRELAQFSDELKNIGGGALPSSHLDPAGRWVVPQDGRYLIELRNLSGGLEADARRTYRLSVRREEPDFQVVAIPRRSDPSGLIVRRGGRELLELLAFRRCGLSGPIRVTATDLPSGLECPDVWLGPDQDRATVVVSADPSAAIQFGELKLEGVAEQAGRRTVRGGTVVRGGTPNGWGRLASRIPLAVAGDAPIRITADGHEALDHHLYGTLQVRHSPGGIVDVAVRVERCDLNHRAPVKLIGVGIPDLMSNQTAVIPAGEEKGYLSFYIPPTMLLGKYSIAVRAETTVPTPDGKTESVVAVSDPVTFNVQPAAFLVEVDPFVPTRARRGEIIQVGYSAQRRNGFIGKMHTELASPGRVTDVVGLRGRGETFVGQTEKGSLQIIVNDDAPLGHRPFLRLFAVGVVEDEPIYHGAAFLNLEIVE